MWDEIWNKKGLEDTNDLNVLSGFDMYNDKTDLKEFNMIIKQCNILKFETILEVGCGAGRLGNIFLENNKRFMKDLKRYYRDLSELIKDINSQ